MVVVKINVMIIIIIIVILNIIKPPNVALSFNINNHESKITDISSTTPHSVHYHHFDYLYLVNIHVCPSLIICVNIYLVSLLKMFI